MPKKPTLKQVGFFMIDFDSFCQENWIKNDQFSNQCPFHTDPGSKTIPNCWG